MAIIDLTTSTRVKAVLGFSDTSEDVWITAAITAVSQRISLHMDRPVELVERTEEYDLHDGRQETLFMRAYPVTAISTIKNSIAWDFGNVTAIDSDLYRADGENGQIHLRTELAAGPKAVQVVYTGGLAANTDDLITDWPVLAHLADLQIAALFRRRATPQGSTVSGKQGGSVSFEGALKLIPEVREGLASFRRVRFGV